ncbi:MAG TPA: Gfo/Idh/MocA family oxidoreductase [Solirubrobacterales bacterium]|nr:Gfo/Idh/MocA family oxidoreductase [Solirubrobacterales bacterium]
MKQVSQRLRDGGIEVLDVPLPALGPEGVLVDVRSSLLSAGTERNKVETGRKSLVGKARARPDQVRQVVDKARRDGVKATVDAVRTRLDQPASLGYSAAGVVMSVGARVQDLAPGDRVACGGGGYAVHADVVHVPGNLCVRLPQGVTFEQGAFATVGSIAMHGVRQADVRLGERVAVIGLGLVGQLTGQLLRAAGCEVVGIDLSEELVERARQAGSAEHAIPRAGLPSDALPAGARDCDAVIVTAATSSDDPVELAALLCRDRGRVVVVGDVGMNVPRAAYYDKEIELRLSRSYGPGRYDRAYEERGLDYPIAYVRWTERRNMEAFVQLIATGKLNVDALVSERVRVEEAPAAYDTLVEQESSPLGILLAYDETPVPAPAEPRAVPPAAASREVATVVGAGSYAQRILIPGLARAGFSLSSVASATGLSARAAADRFGFRRAVGVEEALADQGAGLLVIATRHASHAALAVAGLQLGKAVFVEKPLCLTGAELEELRAAVAASGQPLVAGFNRRHAPLAIALRDHIAAAGQPFNLLYRVNADPLPRDHWMNDLDDGGGRLLGEGCHFVDFACWLAGAAPDRVTCVAAPERGLPVAAAERFTVTMEFPDRSLATILYGSGTAGTGKEYVEAHAGNRAAVLDDYRSLTTFVGRRRNTKRTRSQDKGHAAQFKWLREVLAGRAAPEPSHLDTTEATLAALASAQAT